MNWISNINKVSLFKAFMTLAAVVAVSIFMFASLKVPLETIYDPVVIFMLCVAFPLYYKLWNKQ